MLDNTIDNVVTINSAKEGRDSQGRFIKGHASKGGRPRRATELSFLKKLRDTVDDNAWQQIVNAAVNAAIAGDSKARDWLSSYLLGPPAGSRLMELELQNTRSPMHRLVLAKVSEKIGFDQDDEEEG